MQNKDWQIDMTLQSFAWGFTTHGMTQVPYAAQRLGYLALILSFEKESFDSFFPLVGC
jgi:hypothetical protein